jgi:hypothetical protein
MNRVPTALDAEGLTAGGRDAGVEELADAWARLRASLVALAGDIESRLGERCPHRASDDRCTFIGGCENQRVRLGEHNIVRHCGGDSALNWHGRPREPNESCEPVEPAPCEPREPLEPRELEI